MSIMAPDTKYVEAVHIIKVIAEGRLVGNSVILIDMMLSLAIYKVVLAA